MSAEQISGGEQNRQLPIAHRVYDLIVVIPSALVGQVFVDG